MNTKKNAFLFRLFFLTLLISITISANENATTQLIKVKKSLHRLLKVKLDDVELTMVFDTAAGMTVIDRESFQRKFPQYKLQERKDIVLANATEKELKFTEINRVAIGEFEIPNTLPVMVTNLTPVLQAFDEKIDGVLGLGVFGENIVNVDYFRNQISLISNPDTITTLKNNREHELKLVYRNFIFHALVMDSQNEKKVMLAVLDSGAGISCLNKNLWAGDKKIIGTAKTANIATEDLAELTAQPVFAAMITQSGLVNIDENPIALSATTKFIISDDVSLIGADLFEQAEVVFDLSSKRVWWLPVK